MKRLLYLGLLCLSIQLTQAQTTPASSAAQAATSKEDDTMVLTVTDTPEASWRRLAQVLVQRGYSIQHSDKDLLTLSTDPLTYSRLSLPVSVAGTVVDGNLIVRLYWGNTAETGGGQPLVARRKNDRWMELIAIGQAFGGPVSYTTSVPNY